MGKRSSVPHRNDGLGLQPLLLQLSAVSILAGCASSGAQLTEIAGGQGLIAVTQEIEVKGEEAEICATATNVSRERIALGKVNRDMLGATIYLVEGNIPTGEHQQPMPVFSGEDGRYNPNVLTILDQGQSMHRCIKASFASYDEPIRVVSVADRQFQPPYISLIGRADRYRVLDQPVRASSICTRVQAQWECVKESR